MFLCRDTLGTHYTQSSPPQEFLMVVLRSSQGKLLLAQRHAQLDIKFL